MIHGKKVVCIIPARLASTRFPEKMLKKICNKPLLQWVWEAASTVSYFDECYFAIDDQKIASLLDTFNAPWFMTSRSAASGTDRLVELMHNNIVQADIWVNWQGDEPFINASMIADLLQPAVSDDVCMWTLKKKITNAADIFSPAIAKVVSDLLGNALYFSRSPIPCYRDEEMAKSTFYKHVGLYAFSTFGLRMIQALQPKALENAEKLEMLRFLENGLKVKVHETSYEVFGIDFPGDIERAERYIVAKNLPILQL